MKLAGVELLFQRRLKAEGFNSPVMFKILSCSLPERLYSLFIITPQHLLYQDNLERKLGNIYVH